MINPLNPLASTGLLATCLLSSAIAGSTVTAQTEAMPGEASHVSPPPKIRIGVLYKDTPTGKRHSDRIIEEGEKHDLATQGKVTFIRLPYSKEDEGVGLLIDLIENQSRRFTQANEGKAGGEQPVVDAKNEFTLNGRRYKADYVDIVIGPTESDVFVRALTRIRAMQTKGDLAEAPVPVISALVAANVALSPDGWFFRTNVDAASRADTIYNYINKFWVRSIAVLYANSEFGRNAEQEFQKRLSAHQRKFYKAVLYDDSPPASDSLRRIVADRPEAVGFFCEREDLVRIYRTIPEVNADAMSYKPIVFTVIDARAVAKKVDDMDIYCVTIAGANDDSETVNDDVEKLGVETTHIVMGELQAVIDERENDPDSGESQRAFALDLNELRKFRDRLATLMSRSGPTGSDGWMFTNLTNSSQRQVLHVTSQQSGTIEPVDRTVALFEKLQRKMGLIHGSYGGWPILCAILILIASGVLSWIELKRLFQGSGYRVFGSGFFLLFTVAHFLIVMILYVFLAETGTMRYSQWLAALALCVAPTALLRTTFFETPKGKALGLEGAYLWIRKWVDDELMKARYTALSAKMNLVAYSNSVTVMQRALMDIYRNNPSPNEAGRLVQALEESLRSETDYFERRRLCAYQLLRVLDWDRLKSEGFVSAKWLADAEPKPSTAGAPQPTTADFSMDPDERTGAHLPGTGDQEVLRDPRRIVRLAVQHCKLDLQKRNQIKGLIERHFGSQDQDQRTKELRDFYDAELQKAMSAEGQLNVQIRFLFVLLSFDVDEMIRRQFLTKDQVEKYTNDLIEQYANEQDRRHWLLTNYIFEFPAWIRDLFPRAARSQAGNEMAESIAVAAVGSADRVTSSGEEVSETVPPSSFGNAVDEDSAEQSERRRPPK